MLFMLVTHIREERCDDANLVRGEKRSSPEANWARSLGLRPSSVYIFAESGAAKTAGTLVPTANPILLPRIGHDDSVQAGPAQSFVRIFIELSPSRMSLKVGNSTLSDQLSVLYGDRRGGRYS